MNQWLWSVAVLGLLAGAAAGGEAKGKEAKGAAAPAANPLAKFSEEDLAKVDFCFNTFVGAVSKKDAALALALCDTTPRALHGLDPAKPKDAEKIIAYFKAFEGAELTASQRIAIARAAEITYTAGGKSQTARMSNVAGKWLMTGL